MKLTPMDAFDSPVSFGPGRLHGDGFEHIIDPQMQIGTTCFPPRAGVGNIMITGGAGFIASWVARHLTVTYADYYNIVIFDNLEYAGSMNNIRSLQSLENFNFVCGDIRNYKEVADCIERFRIDTILHFAAKSHVGNSFTDPTEFTVTNVIGTQMLLEAARHVRIRCFLHFSTDEVYGEPTSSDAIDALESSPLHPTNPYAGSKAAAEMIVASYMSTYNLPVIIMRSNNAYGPFQYPEKIIPRFALRLHSGLKLPLHGVGDNTRRYIFARDLADAVDTVLHRGTFGEVYNVESRDELSNRQLCEKLLRLYDLPGDENNLGDWVVQTADRPANDSAYLVNGDKLKALGWTQKVHFEEGLLATVRWYRQHGHRWWGGVSDVLQDVSQESLRQGVSAAHTGTNTNQDIKKGNGTGPSSSMTNGITKALKNHPVADISNGITNGHIDSSTARLMNGITTGVTTNDISHQHLNGH